MYHFKAAEQLEYYESGFGYNCDFDYPYLHDHDYWEFIFVMFDIKHEINGVIRNVPPHSLSVVKPSDAHLIEASVSKRNPDRAPTHMNVKITCDKLKELLDAIDTDLYDALLSSAPLTMQLNDENSVKTLEYFYSTLLWDTNKDFNLIMLKTTVFTFIGLLFKAIYKKTDKKTSVSPEIDEVIKKMNSQKYFTSSINEIASECNYSYMQLTRLFKKVTGLTMQDYFTAVKLDYAANQLRMTTKLIIDISNDIGISSLSHFNHVFKKKFGVPPNAYRKENRI